jgi:hypothetical protein
MNDVSMECVALQIVTNLESFLRNLPKVELVVDQFTQGMAH